MRLLSCLTEMTGQSGLATKEQKRKEESRNDSKTEKKDIGL